MPLMLDDMRAEFARFLHEDPAGRWRMDAALAHVITLSYEAGLRDAIKSEAKRMRREVVGPVSGKINRCLIK